MNPCAFTWAPSFERYSPEALSAEPDYHVCVLEKNHKGDHVSVDGEHAINADVEEVLVENLPMYVNLADAGGFSDWRSCIGRAKVIRDTETGQNKIEIALDEESSKQLGKMVDVFDLKAIGFAGIKRLVHERES